MEELDPFYLALLYFRINQIEDAHNECSKILEKNPLDQVCIQIRLRRERI